MKAPAASSPAGVRRRARDDRGSSTIEYAILFPVLLLVIMVGVQAGLFYHARSIAHAAAEEGARTAAAQTATAAMGEATGADFADRTGSGLLTNVRVDVSRTSTTVTATVSGTASSLIPGTTWTVTQTVTRPVERVTPP